VKVSRRAITIIFGILAISFALGTILLFTPQGQQQSKGRPVVWVNGQPIYEIDLARLQQTDPLFALNPEGALKPLIDTYFLERVILFEALSQDASRLRVSNAEVRKEIERIKEQFGLTDRKAYSRFLEQIGYTDSLLRAEIRRQLQIQKRIDQISKKVSLSDEEARLYFELHKSNYAPEDKVLARQIVVDDRALAEKILGELKAGADFAALAKQYSKIGADQGGALGAAPNSTEPGPVTRLVFPEQVASEVFGLKSGGLTPIIEAGGRYYIVKVEKFLPGGNVKYEEVAEKVKQDALKLKQQGAIETYMEKVRKAAQVKFAENTPYEYKNPVVARVNGTEITLAQLAQQVFSNPQVPQLIQQGLGQLAVQFFFPATLEKMISTELLYQEAQKLGQPFVGPKGEIANDVQLWKTKDITVSEEEVRKYYDDNKIRFTIPAKATVSIAKFKDEASAKAFRQGLLEGKDPATLAKSLKGEYNDFGEVTSDKLAPAVSSVVFGKAPKAKAGSLQVTDVIKLDKEDFEVVVIHAFTPEKLRPYAEVRSEAEALALAEKRAKAAQAWIDELRKKAKIENTLLEVLAELTPKTTESSPAPSETQPQNGETPAQEAPPAKK